MLNILLIGLLFALGGFAPVTKVSSCAFCKEKATSETPVFGFKTVNKFPHDKRSFTEGLAFYDGFLYESIGELGLSAILKVDLKSGKPQIRRRLEGKYFAEGLTILEGNIYQITWLNSIGWVYGLNNFEKIDEFTYAGNGWGLADDETNLYLSDGSHIIRVIDPKTFKTIRTIVVYDEKGAPLKNLNELEFIHGEIWANVWRSEKWNRPNHIARIDPNTGKLNSWLNLDGISPSDSGKTYENSLNGIAYDSVNDRIFVTGKNWKNLYEIIPIEKNQLAASKR